MTRNNISRKCRLGTIRYASGNSRNEESAVFYLGYEDVLDPVYNGINVAALTKDVTTHQTEEQTLTQVGPLKYDPRTLNITQFSVSTKVDSKLGELLAQGKISPAQEKVIEALYENCDSIAVRIGNVNFDAVPIRHLSRLLNDPKAPFVKGSLRLNAGNTRDNNLKVGILGPGKTAKKSTTINGTFVALSMTQVEALTQMKFIRARLKCLMIYAYNCELLKTGTKVETLKGNQLAIITHFLAKSEIMNTEQAQAQKSEYVRRIKAKLPLPKESEYVVDWGTYGSLASFMRQDDKYYGPFTTNLLSNTEMTSFKSQVIDNKLLVYRRFNAISCSIKAPHPSNKKVYIDKICGKVQILDYLYILSVSCFNLNYLADLKILNCNFQWYEDLLNDPDQLKGEGLEPANSSILLGVNELEDNNSAGTLRITDEERHTALSRVVNCEPISKEDLEKIRADRVPLSFNDKMLFEEIDKLYTLTSGLKGAYDEDLFELLGITFDDTAEAKRRADKVVEDFDAKLEVVKDQELLESIAQIQDAADKREEP
jgi:hypothetical protein